jgi:hypothetical protein
MSNHLNTNQTFAITITNLKEMYESNNRLLISITQITNNRILNNAIEDLINSLINSNNEIKNSIIDLSNIANANTNTNTNANVDQSNYINETFHNNYIYTLPAATGARFVDASFANFFDPVEIFPTQDQIEIATKVARFGDIVFPLNISCPISLDFFSNNSQVLVIRQCNHIFNINELQTWFRVNCKCPVCRYDIRDYTILGPPLQANPGRNILSDRSGEDLIYHFM